MEFGTLETILACVAAGLGITLLPRSLVSTTRFSDRLAVLALPASEANVETVFVTRRDAATSSALAAFLALAGQAFRRATSAPRARRAAPARPGANARKGHASGVRRAQTRQWRGKGSFDNLAKP
jgi:hypothetical protein